MKQSFSDRGMNKYIQPKTKPLVREYGLATTPTQPIHNPLPFLRPQPRTFLVLSRTVGEQVLAAEVDPVPVEVVRLEEARPELGLGHPARNVLEELAPHRRVRLVDGVDGVHVEVVLEPVAAVRLRFDVGLAERGDSQAGVFDARSVSR